MAGITDCPRPALFRLASSDRIGGGLLPIADDPKPPEIAGGAHTCDLLHLSPPGFHPLLMHSLWWRCV